MGKSSVDLATIIGLIAAFAVLGVAIAVGGSAAAFIDMPSILIVVGGTVAVTTICFSLPELGRAIASIAQTLLHRLADPAQAAVTVLKLADKARKDGLLSLEGAVAAARGEPFLAGGLRMVVDGAQSDEVEAVLRRELGATSQHQLRAASVLRKAAEVAPAMGLIGTLVGLVQMLGNLSDPTAIGPGMAIALLTTFYGAMLANMVFAPLAAKLERNAGEAALVHNIYLTGVASIGRQENPRRLENLLNALLPPAKRIRFYA